MVEESMLNGQKKVGVMILVEIMEGEVIEDGLRVVLLEEDIPEAKVEAGVEAGVEVVVEAKVEAEVEVQEEEEQEEVEGVLLQKDLIEIEEIVGVGVRVDLLEKVEVINIFTDLRCS